jgi:hypothetical protein
MRPDAAFVVSAPVGMIRARHLELTLGVFFNPTSTFRRKNTIGQEKNVIFQLLEASTKYVELSINLEAST